MALHNIIIALTEEQPQLMEQAEIICRSKNILLLDIETHDIR
jgi:hypothetical protein